MEFNGLKDSKRLKTQESISAARPSSKRGNQVGEVLL
jgi:hypothetical protein